MLLPSVPLDLEKAITRALRKEPERRFQSMSDLGVALLEVKEALESGTFVSADQIQRSIPRRRMKAWHGVAAAILAVLVGMGGWVMFRDILRPPELEPRIAPLTTLPGREWEPTLSPSIG